MTAPMTKGERLETLEAEVEPTADTRPVDCSRCRRYAERFIENIGRVLSGEW